MPRSDSRLLQSFFGPSDENDRHIGCGGADMVGKCVGGVVGVQSAARSTDAYLVNVSV